MVPNLKKLPEGLLEVLCSQKQTDNQKQTAWLLAVSGMEGQHKVRQHSLETVPAVPAEEEAAEKIVITA